MEAKPVLYDKRSGVEATVGIYSQNSKAFADCNKPIQPTIVL